MYSAGGNKLATAAYACALFWFLVGARIASEQIWPETGPEATSTPTCAALRCKRITTDAIRNRANQPGFLFWESTSVAQRLDQDRAAINGLQEMARAGDGLGDAVAWVIGLSADEQEAILLLTGEAFDASVAVGIEGIGQTENGSEFDCSLTLACGES